MKSDKADYALHSSRVLTEQGLGEYTVFVKEGLISKVLPGKVLEEGLTLHELGNLVLMPGLIDSHVHINEPGRTDWEGFDTMTKAALAGGITTLIDMPLNASPVTTTAENLHIKIQSSEGKRHCHLGFWGGLVPDNLHQLDELIHAGVLGIKAFMTHSGIDDFPNVSAEELRKGMAILAKYQIPLLAHAELDEPHAGLEFFKENPTSFMAFLKSRPKEWEDKAVDILIALCAEFKSPVHIVHLSSANRLPEIKAAREQGLPLTVETCPHYLFFCAEEVPDRNTLYKCTPPIREAQNNELLWKALKDGTLDFVVTDHSPAPPELKKTASGNLLEAWGGIASIQFSLPVMWTIARKRKFTLEQLSAWMSTHVAQFIGYGNSKGKIQAGYDADLVVWDPEEEFTVEASQILYRHQITPYLGQDLNGRIKQTYLKGKKVYDQGQFTALAQGELLLKKY
jgi:allantoinase